MELKFLQSIHQVTPSQWNSLWPSNYPFTKWAFLAALEDSQCTTPETGWQINHACVFKGDQLLSAMPLYFKSHSYGEYVFDWAWADAYHRFGLHYYPKLLNAIPFTPCTGPRWASQNNQATEFLFEQLINYTRREVASSFHCLFPNSSPNPESVFLKRLGCQFQWFNNNYTDFHHFLDSFNSRKRKNVKKERDKIHQQKIHIDLLEGAQLTPQDWQQFTQLYARTYLKRSGHTGYLNENFFQSIGKSIPENIVLAKAFSNGECVAAALFFKDDFTLYGRYWGCREEFDSLHFECCYYQGIEYAIDKKIARFDSGAQGEHKIQRGFTPILTQSFHLINDKNFAPAIEDFIQAESKQVEQYCKTANSHLPFKGKNPTSQ